MCRSGCELQLCYLVPDNFVSLFCYVGRGQTVWAANASLDVSTKLNSTETRVWSELRAICVPQRMGLWHLWLPICFVSGEERKLLLFFQANRSLFFLCKIASNRATTVAVIKRMSHKPTAV